MTHLAIARRHYARITTTALAERLGTTQPYISRLEAGKVAMTTQYAQRIAEALDVSPAWLLGVPETMPLSDPLSDATWLVPILRSEEIPGYGVLYHVWLDADDADIIVPVIIAGGVQITPYDWYSSTARTAAGIPDHKWIGPRGEDCIMLDNLPRILG